MHNKSMWLGLFLLLFSTSASADIVLSGNTDREALESLEARISELQHELRNSEGLLKIRVKSLENLSCTEYNKCEFNMARASCLQMKHSLQIEICQLNQELSSLNTIHQQLAKILRYRSMAENQLNQTNSALSLIQLWNEWNDYIRSRIAGLANVELQVNNIPLKQWLQAHYENLLKQIHAEILHKSGLSADQFSEVVRDEADYRASKQKSWPEPDNTKTKWKKFLISRIENTNVRFIEEAYGQMLLPLVREH